MLGESFAGHSHRDPRPWVLRHGGGWRVHCRDHDQGNPHTRRDMARYGSNTLGGGIGRKNSVVKKSCSKKTYQILPPFFADFYQNFLFSSIASLPMERFRTHGRKTYHIFPSFMKDLYRFDRRDHNQGYAYSGRDTANNRWNNWLP